MNTVTSLKVDILNYYHCKFLPASNLVWSSVDWFIYYYQVSLHNKSERIWIFIVWKELFFIMFGSGCATQRRWNEIWSQNISVWVKFRWRLLIFIWNPIDFLAIIWWQRWSVGSSNFVAWWFIRIFRNRFFFMCRWQNHDSLLWNLNKFSWKIENIFEDLLEQPQPMMSFWSEIYDWTTNIQNKKSITTGI